ncbi:phosphotransferase family enzyme [Kribbella orskensis]|uniref:Phosphotransferase family enzyme n=1 Tax=Kribbella orskensis TaxID=2512216 RepID=A0ABY2BU05_9ACTN|nr:phosphotransferase family enzyme [Kribbella sp. VKM Ac-2500]TCO31580.1 phosphotransferase family enzyme [Kribbella orskensis]
MLWFRRRSGRVCEVERHPAFSDIALHTDDELAEALGAPIEERETIHVWPLSCVQRVLLADGSKLVYKAQLPPTVEPEFYQAASSKLLPDHQDLGGLDASRSMTIEWIDAPLLADLELEPTELVEHGRRLVTQIGEIGGQLPTYLTIGDEQTWSDLVDEVLERHEKLLADGRFTLTNHESVRRVRAWAAGDEVLNALTATPQVIHGDLKADQVFITSDGYRVIDWQRPVLAPADVDLVLLLVDQGIDPRDFVDPAIVGIFWFLRLHWAVEAQYTLFPDNRWRLFDEWSQEAITTILG